MPSNHVYVMEEELLFSKRSRRAIQYQNRLNLAIKYSKICISFIFCDKYTHDVFKAFCLQMMSGLAAN